MSGFEFNLSTASTSVGLNALRIETLSGVRQNVAIGTNALQNNTIGRYSCAVGYGALQTQIGVSDSQNVAVGYESLVNVTTGKNTVAIGYRSGSQMTAAQDNIFIGSGADFDSTTQYSNSIALGALSLITASNQCVLATRATTVNIPGSLQLAVNPTIITANTTLTLPLYQFYSVAPTANIVVTLPTPVAALAGVTIAWRRVSGTITNTITSGVGATNVLRLVTLGNQILNASEYQSNLVCMLISTGPNVYAWCNR
jgi:hypothetical protein